MENLTDKEMDAAKAAFLSGINVRVGVALAVEAVLNLRNVSQEGSKPSAAPLRDFCPDCGGGGKVGSGEFETDCRRCDGTGLVEPEGFIPGEPTPSPGERGDG